MKYSLLPETLFQNKVSGGRIYSETDPPGGRICFEIESPGETFRGVDSVARHRLLKEVGESSAQQGNFSGVALFG